MNRIRQLFQEKKNNILSIYFTAGYPRLEQTKEIIAVLDSAGADMVEIGIPFSDPMADGLTIQESNDIALKNGMSLSLLLEQLKDIRNVTHLPLLLMGYLNPIIQYGFDAFCKDAKRCGIDALIVPDIPLPEYQDTYKDVMLRHGLKFIFLITPQTTTERIRFIDELSDGFIYLVTSPSVTGKSTGFTDIDLLYLDKVKSMRLNNPVLAGFDICNQYDFDLVNQYVNGAIIGSCFIRVLNDAAGNIGPAIREFVQSIR